MADQQRYSPRRQASSDSRQSRPLWQYYTGITALLLLMVLALTGGIIWYNSKKTNQLAGAPAGGLRLTPDTGFGADKGGLGPQRQFKGGLAVPF